MDAKEILDKLLDTSQTATRKGLEVAEQKLGVPEEGPERDAMLGGLGKGALAAGAVAVLLGTKGGRQLTGTALKVGGLAAVGGLAYKAFNDWKQQQGDTVVVDTGAPIGELEQRQAGARSEAIVRAMIAAARSDGHIDKEEQQLITLRINSLGLEQDVSSFLMEELNQPSSVAGLALAADSPEAAAEMYLAAAMVVDTSGTAERAFLDSFAEALKLDASLTQSLEAQVS